MKANPEESYTNKYQKHIACSYAYKLVCVDDKFIKPFNMIQENKYCSDVIIKHFNKELVMTKEDNENFTNSIKCWICDNGKDHCHITG